MIELRAYIQTRRQNILFAMNLWKHIYKASKRLIISSLSLFPYQTDDQQDNSPDAVVVDIQPKQPQQINRMETCRTRITNLFRRIIVAKQTWSKGWNLKTLDCIYFFFIELRWENNKNDSRTKTLLSKQTICDGKYLTVYIFEETLRCEKIKMIREHSYFEKRFYRNKLYVGNWY